MFYGRNEELLALRSVIDSAGAGIAIVYGRRRIGKTSLIRQALSESPSLIVEGLEGRSKRDQITHFVYQVAYQLDVARPDCDSWEQAFMFLYEVLKKQPRHIVLDEFQWMANYRREIVSDLKAVWEQYLSALEGVSLILCGSVASFMVRKVIKSSALYGRVDLEINLKGFQLKETSRMLDGRGISEIVEAQMFSGGVLKYIELLAAQPSIRLGMGKLSFDPNGYFATEYQRIFVSHLGKNADYEKIIDLLAKRPYGMLRTELKEQVISGGRLTEILNNLEMAGFISSCAPVDKCAGARLTKYWLVDAYLRFYFSFIKPSLRKIDGGGKMLAERTMQSAAFYSWMGYSFEYLCLQHAGKLADLLGFGGIEYDVGPWFRRREPKKKGLQVDLMYSRSDQVITFCEMKYSLRPVGMAVVAEVEEKAERLAQFFPTQTIQRVLITSRPVSRELEACGYFYRIITVDELIS